jgi:hypothetical protein
MLRRPGASAVIEASSCTTCCMNDQCAVGRSLFTIDDFALRAHPRSGPL